MSPKIVAFYLPQFHRIPENDKWWGEGFTDWVAARKARPLFPGHRQPRVPKNEYYYDLLDKKTLKWQAALAKKYNVYGFCIYHYWFGEKQLLEKPAENLLAWKDIDVNYCFSWANLSWVASWSGLKGNAWTNSISSPDKKNGYLVKQEYGGKEEWKRHFAYLLPFFQDERYIKVDNSPVFVIYKPDDIKGLRPMTQCWNELAKENGFNGIYFVGTNYEEWEQKGMNAMLLYEPAYTFREKRGIRSFYRYKLREWMGMHNILYPRLEIYGALWRRIVRRQNGNHVWPGGLVDFDNTPRKGKKGLIFIGATPRKFGKYLHRLAEKNKDKEFIFLTAWNEWGEGAYLEPDSRNGVSYLKGIKALRGRNQ